MLEREYEGYGFNEPERFETMAMQTRVEYEPDKNIKVGPDKDGLMLGQEDAVPSDLLVPKVEKHKVEFKGENDAITLEPTDPL